MSTKKQFKHFTIPELKTLREEVLDVTSIEELLEIIDRTIQEKEIAATESLNARFLVDWFNIDPAYIRLLHENGINNMHQLREVKDIWQLKGMTHAGHAQISWARDFFDMTLLEKLPPEKRTTENIVKKTVAHAQACYKKHKNI